MKRKIQYFFCKKYEKLIWFWLLYRFLYCLLFVFYKFMGVRGISVGVKSIVYCIILCLDLLRLHNELGSVYFFEGNYFSHPMGFLARPIFSKNVLDVSGFRNPEWCFLLLKGEKMSYEFFQISLSGNFIFPNFVIRKLQKIGCTTWFFQ